MSIIKYPGESKSRVNSAGEAIRNGEHLIESEKIIDEWRAAHRIILNVFQILLRSRTKGKPITVAQRHKRKKTIYDKLTRFPKMNLARMDDVAGCRLIFKNIDDLYEFRESMLGNRRRFKHERKNEIDKYDYIKKPKVTGYRGIHDVYSYNVESRSGEPLKGLLIEVQYRTLIQHSWATAVEIIGFITQNQPKFQRGDKRYEKAMLLASEILARAFEIDEGSFTKEDNKKLVTDFLAIDNEIHVMRTLKGLNKDNQIAKNRNAILIFQEDGTLEIKTFKDSAEALRELFKLEQEIPDIDLVLVKADTNEQVRLAFTNYFSDAIDFIENLEKGCEELSGHKIINHFQ